MKVGAVIISAITSVVMTLFALTAIANEQYTGEYPSYVVAWTGPDDGVWLQLFDDKGLHFKEYNFSNMYTVVRPARFVTDALLLSSGDTVVAYRERSQRYTWLGNYVQFYDSQGNEKFKRIKLDASCNQRGGQLAQVTPNSFIVSMTCANWRDLMIDEFDFHGNRLTEKSVNLIKEDEKLDLYRISSFQNGGVLVTWREFDREDKYSPTAIKAQTFDRAYNSISPVIEVAVYEERVDHRASHSRDPVATVLSSGRFVIAWSEGGAGAAYKKRILGRVYGINGDAVSQDLVIGAGQKPEITELQDSGFAITWIEGGKLYAKKYNHLGMEKGDRQTVNDNSLTPSFGEPVGLKNGAFAVSWYGCEIDANGCMHFSRFFGSDGKPVRPSERIYYDAPDSTRASSNAKWLRGAEP